MHRSGSSLNRTVPDQPSRTAKRQIVGLQRAIGEPVAERSARRYQAVPIVLGDQDGRLLAVPGKALSTPVERAINRLPQVY
jgi:hypothetical protein